MALPSALAARRAAATEALVAAAVLLGAAAAFARTLHAGLVDATLWPVPYLLAFGAGAAVWDSFSSSQRQLPDAKCRPGARNGTTLASALHMAVAAVVLNEFARGNALGVAANVVSIQELQGVFYGACGAAIFEWLALAVEPAVAGLAGAAAAAAAAAIAGASPAAAAAHALLPAICGAAFRRLSPGSFTRGESLLLGAVASIFAGHAAVAAAAASWPRHGAPGVLVIALVLGILVSILATLPVTRRLSPLRLASAKKGHGAASPSRRFVLSALFYALFAIFVLGVIQPLCERAIGANAFTWTVAYIWTGAHGRALVAYWSGAILALVLVRDWLCAPTATRRERNLRRKLYHFIAVAMFVPGWYLNKTLLTVAQAFVLAAFLALETVRMRNMWPLSHVLHQFLYRFVEPKDESGPLLTSPIYLLLGCALPLWLESMLQVQSDAAALAGVLVLGIGDALASIVGLSLETKFKTRWFGPGYSRSVQGSAAMAAGVLAFALALAVGVPTAAFGPWISIMAAVLLTTLLEAATDQNDNLVLPLCFFAVYHVCARLAL